MHSLFSRGPCYSPVLWPGWQHSACGLIGVTWLQVYGLCTGMFAGSVVNCSLYAYLTSTTPWEQVRMQQMCICIIHGDMDY